MKNNPLVIIGGVIIAVLVVVAVGIGVWSEHANERTRACLVTDKDRTTVTSRDSAPRSDMRIYTNECGTLAVADLVTRGQFESADIYAAIEPGKLYEITTVGWRIGYLSAFPIIVGTPVEVTR